MRLIKKTKLTGWFDSYFWYVQADPSHQWGGALWTEYPNDVRDNLSLLLAFELPHSAFVLIYGA
jgi:hypothetical protein